MNNMQKNTIKRILIAYLAILAAICLLQLSYHVNLQIEKVANHQIAEKLLTKDWDYVWDHMDENLQDITTLTKARSLTPEDAGELYERAALIYFSKGDTVNYFQNLGYALYYLKQSDDYDHTINVYLDLANFFLNNYSNEEAMAMFEAAQKVRPFEEIEDVQVKSYAYRMLGIMSILKLEYNDAETYFNKSLRLLEESNNGSFEEQYTAMTEIWLSRVYEETGRLPKCKEVLDKWSDYFMFESDKFKNLYLRDFIIPYYQAKCYYLCAENIKERNNATPEENEARARAVIDYIHEFMTLCEENHYEKAELYTLLKIQREYPTRNEEIQTELYQVVDELYSNIYTQQNKTYASVINTIVSNSLDELRVKDSEFSKNITRFRLFLFSLLVVSLFILLIIILLINNRMDGMTGLLSRRIFDTDIKRYARTNSEYGVIMLDIDNFKNINDSYGHPEGDIVIRRLSQLISKETTSGIKAYRYGGEEFSIIVDKSELPYIDKIAERIRDYMEQQGWEFDSNIVITLSIGIAVGIGENIVKQADDNLYISKQTGKNRVTHL